MGGYNELAPRPDSYLRNAYANYYETHISLMKLTTDLRCGKSTRDLVVWRKESETRRSFVFDNDAYGGADIPLVSRRYSHTIDQTRQLKRVKPL